MRRRKRRGSKILRNLAGERRVIKGTSREKMGQENGAKKNVSSLRMEKEIGGRVPLK